MSEGYVYVLVNEAMPGIIKIGLTQNLTERLKQLNNTSAPLPFVPHYAAKVPDCRRLERTLHFVFGDMRVNPKKEFFRADPDLARAIIELVAIDEETPTLDVDRTITPQQRVQIEKQKSARAARLTFERLGLKTGAVLTFTKDPTITCTIAGPKTVRLDGKEMSLSAAALQVVHAMGYTWPTVNGNEYWAHNGVKLAAMETQASRTQASQTQAPMAPQPQLTAGDPPPAEAPALPSQDAPKSTTPGKRATLQRLGLKLGDVLAFLKDPSITCTVASPSAVTFRGQQMSPSAAALLAIREMGYGWTSISGSEYWTYNGVKLSAMGSDPKA